MEKILLEIILRHMEKKEAIGHRQHGFTKGKSCLKNFLPFYNVITVFVDKGSCMWTCEKHLTLPYITFWSLNWRYMDLTDGLQWIRNLGALK